MTEEAAGNAPEKANAAEGRGRITPITRDATFCRFVVDDVIIVPRNEVEIELAHIAFGPDPVSRNDTISEGGGLIPGPVVVRASLNEVARCRIDIAAATNMSMRIIEYFIKRGSLDVDALRNGIDEIIANAPLPEAKSDA